MLKKKKEQKNSEDMKDIKLRICRRAKKYCAIHQVI